MMGDKEDALFNQKVRGVIRKCALVTAPVWGTVVTALGVWLWDMHVSVNNNTRTLTKVETQVDYMYREFGGRK